jgi:hypothetical protein
MGTIHCARRELARGLEVPLDERKTECVVCRGRLLQEHALPLAGCGVDPALRRALPRFDERLTMGDEHDRAERRNGPVVVCLELVSSDRKRRSRPGMS